MYDVIYNVIIIIKLNYGWLCIFLSTNKKEKRKKKKRRCMLRIY
jgi:hypothetical protein